MVRFFFNLLVYVIMSPFKVQGINHIGLAPKDPERARWFFAEALQMSFAGDEYVPSQKTHTVMFDSADEDVPASRLEILIPDDDPDSPIAKFLANKGSGIHHIAVAVDDIEAALDHLRSLSVELIDTKPRAGAHHTKIAFVHPRATGGLLVELVQQMGSVT